MSRFVIATVFAVASCAREDAHPQRATTGAGVSSRSAASSTATITSNAVAAFGKLALTVNAPDGAPWTGACAVVATPVAGGLPRALTDVLQRGPSIDAELPIGRWRVHVDSDEPVHSCCVKTPELSRCGDREVECDIIRGETTALTVGLRAGGRVSLTLALPDGFESAEITALRALAECDRRERVVELADGKHENSCAIVSLVNRDGAVVKSMSFLPPCCTRLAIDRAILGLTLLSEKFFDPGSLALRIEAPGFEPANADVTIESGRDADVRVALKAAIAK